MVAYARERALEANLSPNKVVSVIDCETAGTWNPKKQSGHYYRRSAPEVGIYAGEQEKSFGLAQIHLPRHPEVTYEEATDPYYAIEFLITHLQAGDEWMWSCY